MPAPSPGDLLGNAGELAGGADAAGVTHAGVGLVGLHGVTPWSSPVVGVRVVAGRLVRGVTAPPSSSARGGRM